MCYNYCVFTDERTIFLNRTALNKKYCLISFAAGLVIFIFCAVPLMYDTGGIFLYYGDFNCQTVPFLYKMTGDISSFQIPQYDFSAGTGLDYLEAYTFYNLFSPFTLLASLIPNSVMIYAVSGLIALKLGCCAMFAYMYASRFCRDDGYAVTGALLYTYSGYTIVTFLFHYLDALVFFPLLLYALETAVTEKRRGLFGIAAAVCALTNYYIFAAEVIFIIIYFLVRLTDSNFRIGIKDFLLLGAESVLGVMCAGIALVPAAYSVLNSTRMGDSYSLSNVLQMLVYESAWRYPRIVQSIFMAPDIQGYTNFFPDFKGAYPYGSRWSSQALYLPVFGMSGVIAFICANKKSWQTKLAAICTVMMFIPVLNSIFSMGSTVYYARWMFAPSLIFAVMTACAMEREPKHFKTGLIINGGVVLAIALFRIFVPIEKLTLWQSGATYNMVQSIVQLAVTAAGLAVSAAVLFKMKRDESYSQKVIVLVCAMIFVYAEGTFIFGMADNDDTDYIVHSYTVKPETEETTQGHRLASDAFLLNYHIFWERDSVYLFNSAQPESIGRFYEAFETYSGSVPSNYELCTLCSVKELIVYNDDGIYADTTKMENPSRGFDKRHSFKGIQDYYAVYENPDYIPMGFCYDYCISEEDFLALDLETRERLVLKAMVVKDTSAVSDYLEIIPKEKIFHLSDEEFSEECNKRRAETAHTYSYDGDTAKAEITLSQPELVFFSITHSDNFTAYVDGEKTDIINANFGFMAVPVSEGTHTVELVYHSKQRDIGMILTAAGFAGLAVYIAAVYIYKRKHKSQEV